jgi:DNA-binding beta-propeller fold protein YncE
LVFVTDRSYPVRIQELAPDDAVVVDKLDERPQRLAVDANTGTIYVADTFNDRLVAITPSQV